MDRRRTAGLLVLGLTTAGCGALIGPVSSVPEPPTSVPEPSIPAVVAGWDEPPDYRYTVESSCGERAFIGRYRVEVRDRAVASAEEMDPDDQRWVEVDPRWLPDVMTLGEIAEQARQASESGRADRVAVATDAGDGHPTHVSIDVDANSIDDESCYVISDYRPGG